MAARKSLTERLFTGVYPGGIVYSDRSRSRGGDYVRVAFLPYTTLVLEVEKGEGRSDLLPLIRKDAERMAARRGERFPIDAAGHTVVLGGKPRGRIFGYAVAAAVGYGAARVVDGSLKLPAPAKGSSKGGGGSQGYYVLLYNYAADDASRKRDRRLKGFEGPFATKSEADAVAKKSSDAWFPEVRHLSKDPMTLGLSSGRTGRVAGRAHGVESSTPGARGKGWEYYARRSTDSEIVKITSKVAREIYEKGPKNSYEYAWAHLYEVPPMYVRAREGLFRVEKGFIVPTWTWIEGRRVGGLRGEDPGTFADFDAGRGLFAEALPLIDSASVRDFAEKNREKFEELALLGLAKRPYGRDSATRFASYITVRSMEG
jgi:hypothetical protein